MASPLGEALVEEEAEVAVALGGVDLAAVTLVAAVETLLRGQIPNSMLDSEPSGIQCPPAIKLVDPQCGFARQVVAPTKPSTP